jgi:hypothetical protein
MGQQQPPGGVHHPGQPLPPVPGGGLVGLDAGQQVVDQGVEQCLLVGDVGVEGVGQHPQLGGQAAHGEAVHPLGVGDAAGGGKDLLAGQAGPLAGAAVARTLGT